MYLMWSIGNNSYKSSFCSSTFFNMYTFLLKTIHVVFQNWMFNEKCYPICILYINFLIIIAYQCSDFFFVTYWCTATITFSVHFGDCSVPKRFSPMKYFLWLKLNDRKIKQSCSKWKIKSFTGIAQLRASISCDTIFLFTK